MAVAMRAVQTLKTPRFSLRPLHRSDAAALWPTLSDPDQCLYLTREAFASEDELWDWLSDPAWNGRTWIAEDADGEVAARFVAVPGHAEGVEEIGYITCAHRQREGIATEGVRAVIAHLFEEGARKLTAEVDVRNDPSFALLESLGFRLEAHLREHDATHLGLCDVYWYGLLRSDWDTAAR